MYKISLLLVFSLINLVFGCPGCIDLDELTFAKTIQKFKTALVKFDVAFPYGANHENYAKFSQEINNKTISGNSHPDVLIATIGVKDYGDLENKKIADKYNIKPESFPVVKLFNNGDLDHPVHYERGTEDITTEKLFLFMKKHSIAYIQAPGCSQELDKLTETFMTEKGQRTDILKQAESAMEKIECEKKKSLSKFYTVLMKGIIEKGDDFIEKQHERMHKLLKDKLSEKKIEELTKKLNILSSFKYRENSKDEL